MILITGHVIMTPEHREHAIALGAEHSARARADARYQRLLIVAEVGLHERAADAKYREYFGREARTIEDPNAPVKLVADGPPRPLIRMELPDKAKTLAANHDADTALSAR